MIINFIVFTLLVWSYSSSHEENEYDYIIVGAGSSGAALANRLTELEDVTVLLIEAGGKPSSTSDIPYLAISLQQTPEDWNYTTEAQEFACQGFENKKCYYPRGKVLGGSSVLNYMVYARGNRRDYDNWEKNGATGWSYDEVLPYFKKAEGSTVIGPIDNELHGRDGPLTVSHPPYQTKLQEAYIEAAESIGFATRDTNGKDQIGFSVVQATTRSGFRCSTEKAYLRPAYNRKNLHILTGALVTKVKIEDKEARGVHYCIEGVCREAKAKREVIVSAGSINTPQILMLSGIGPKSQLENLGIEVEVDLPVGQNLQDHVTTMGVHYTINTTDAFVLSRILAEEYTPGTGPLTSPCAVETIGFVKSKFEKEPGDFPDIEIIVLSTLITFPFLSPQIKAYFEPYSDRDTFTILPVVLRPLSIGNLTLKSSSPNDAPVITIPFLSNKHDLKILVEGMKWATTLAESEPLRKFGPQRLKGSIPGCEIHEENSEKYLECVAATLSTTVYHPIGTCKMGNPEEADTVVDPELRVKGIGRLRVVDASVMPTMVSGHTNAAAIMIAEKAADIIKNTKYEDLAPSVCRAKQHGVHCN